VTNVAQKLYEAGAAVFHIDNETSAEAGSESVGVETPAAAPRARGAGPVPAAKAVRTALRPFLAGRAGQRRRARAARGVEEATPTNCTSCSTRAPNRRGTFGRHYQAEYHPVQRPIQALEIRAFDTPTWERPETAGLVQDCRGAAHDPQLRRRWRTLERLVEHFPAEDCALTQKLRAIHRDAVARGNHTGKLPPGLTPRVARCRGSLSHVCCRHKTC
jgi:hypothetical protein